MQADTDIRPGEVVGTWPRPDDASLCFIGRVSTPWPTRAACPKRGDLADGQILYWMHQARRDLLQQRPRGSDVAIGTFSLRSPVRPNPIAVSRVALVGVEVGVLLVRGLDCIDGTPLIDVKPDRCPISGR